MMRRVLAVFVCVALLAHAAHVDVQSEDAEDEFDLDLATTPAPAVRFQNLSSSHPLANCCVRHLSPSFTIYSLSLFLTSRP